MGQNTPGNISWNRKDLQIETWDLNLKRDGHIEK